MQNSNSSLAEELDNAQNRIIKCVPCDYKSHSFQSQNNHTARSHDCSSIKQKVKLTSTLFKLKEKETLTSRNAFAGISAGFTTTDTIGKDPQAQKYF